MRPISKGINHLGQEVVQYTKNGEAFSLAYPNENVPFHLLSLLSSSEVKDVYFYEYELDEVDAVYQGSFEERKLPDAIEAMLVEYYDLS
jgi:hypothetical protein